MELDPDAAHGACGCSCDMLGCDENRVRVVTPDVGGGFGPKLIFYPEDVAVALAAMLSGRPVKWIEDRREHFVATTQERDQYLGRRRSRSMTDARILGIRGTLIHDHGAYTARGVNLPVQIRADGDARRMRCRAYRMNVRLALTNKVPVTPVRGAGHPQGAFAMERLLGPRGARAEARSRRGAPPQSDSGRQDAATPNRSKRAAACRSCSTCGDYPKCQQMALERDRLGQFAKRRQAARARRAAISALASPIS